MSFFNVGRFALYSLLLLIVKGGSAQFSAMSFNIRLDTDADGDNAWDYRRHEMVDFISLQNPDFLGIQEGLYHQVMFLNENLPGYEFIGKGRDDGDRKGEFSCIFYKKNAWRPVEENTYWLSPTPDKVSKGWDAALERIFTYGVFVHQLKSDTVHLVNTHFDHMGQEARLQSARLILDFLRQKGLHQKKIIVMGDLNCGPEDKPLQVLKEELTDAYDVVPHYQGEPMGTFNGFDTLKAPTARIDYILYKNLKVKTFSVIDERREKNMYLSDHLPVRAEFTD